MSDYSDLVTLADFGKEIDVTAQTVKGWMDKEQASHTEFGVGIVVKPVMTFGNTNVYSRKALLELAANKGNTQAIKTAGYVHPDKFKESEDARIRLSGELAALQDAYNRLSEECEQAQRDYVRAADELGWTRKSYDFENDSI